MNSHKQRLLGWAQKQSTSLAAGHKEGLACLALQNTEEGKMWLLSVNLWGG